MSRLPALTLGLSIVLVVGCAPPVEPRFSESASSGTRPAWTREDLDAVVAYAEEDGHGPVQDTSISRHGGVVVFAETVISYGVDPVRRVWRHDLPGEVVATALSSEQVTGVDGDPLTLLFGGGTIGDSLFVDARTGSIPAEVAPWSQVPELSSHLEAPLQHAEAAPKEIVLFDPLPREGRGRLYLAAARALIDDEKAPVALEDLDESLLIDGELMEHLGQWGDSPDLMFGRLENSLNEALG